LAFVLGRLKVKRGLGLADFPQVGHYPDMEKSVAVGASICSAVNMLWGSMLPKYAGDAWVQYFWKRSLDLHPLDLRRLEKEMSDESKFEDLIRAIEVKIRRELGLRCAAYTPEFRMPEVFDVLTALLARQATLAIEMASAPQLWNGHSAPLFLRAMTDVHITLAWILLDAKTRARQYIDYGLWARPCWNWNIGKSAWSPPTKASKKSSSK
jgi:hypothetical protein